MCARRGRRPRIGLAAAVVATALAAIGQFAPVASANPTDTAGLRCAPLAAEATSTPTKTPIAQPQVMGCSSAR